MRLIASRPEDYLGLKEATWREFAVPEGGLEPADILDMLAGWSGRLNAAQGWGSWLAVEAGEVVASLAIKAPAKDGAVEIGYGVAPARRGRGFATMALGLALAELAARGIRQVTAETSPGNPASSRVLAKAGFAWIGRRQDPDDGTMDQWRREIG